MSRFADHGRIGAAFERPMAPTPTDGRDATLAASAVAASEGSGGLILSEVVEGSSNNKAVELFNGTGADIDLDGYTLSFYFNGSTSAGTNIALTGSIAAGGTYVIADNDAVLGLTPDLTSTASFFNGDDAIVLTDASGNVVDSFGTVGVDPGSEWAGGSQDDTLRRKAGVVAGDTDPTDAFDATAEWDSFPQDDFSDLGDHGETALQPLLINEVLGSTTGTDSEYVELIGAPGQSLAGLSLVVVESDEGPANGTIDFRYDFASDAVIGENGFLLLANATAEGTYGVTADIVIPDNAIENSSYTIALVETASLPDGDTGVPVSGAEVVLDSVGVSDGGANDAFAFGAPVVGPDGSFLPAGVGRVQDGVDTDAAADWQILNFNNGAPNDPTSGGTRDGNGGGGGDPILISTIQGAGNTSAYAGQSVTVEAVVTQISDALGGFFIQEELADDDGNDATSEGLFVFNFGNDAPAMVGDVIRLTGTITEFQRSSESFSLTQFAGYDSIEIVSGGATLPPSAEIALPLPEGVDPLAYYEMYENMRVSVVAAEDERLTVTDTYTAFGEVGVTSGDPLLQPTQVYESFTPEQEALAEANARDYLLFEDGDNDALSGAPRVGDGIVGDRIDGVMFSSFGDFKVETTGTPVEFDATVNPYPQTVEPEDVGGRLQVATFNVLNYFTTLGARGASTPEELADQTSKIVAALAAIDADVVGLIEIENDLDAAAGPDEATRALVDALNERVGAGTYDYIATGKVGTDEIKQAIIYKTATVAPSGDYAVLDTEAFTAPYTPGDPQSRPAIAQTFVEVDTGEKFTVAVNHLKSKGSPTGAVVDGEADDNPVEGSAALTRVAAAEALAEWLESDPTGQGDADYLILGDLNAYAMERAIQALEAEGYTNLVGSDAFSYQFDGRLGSLDYALANEAILDQVTGATVWHPNSLEAYSIQYDGRDFDAFGDAGSPYASSDHDPVIVGLDLETEVPLPVVYGREGSGIVKGTEAAEILDGQGGRVDIARGRGGDDVFRFVDIEGERDSLTILDYAAGDRLDLNGETIAETCRVGRNLLISLDGDDGDSIFVHGITDVDQIEFYGDLVA